jgi:hypothetical protein
MYASPTLAPNKGARFVNVVVTASSMSAKKVHPITNLTCHLPGSDRTQAATGSLKRSIVRPPMRHQTRFRQRPMPRMPCTAGDRSRA